MKISAQKRLVRVSGLLLLSLLAVLVVVQVAQAAQGAAGFPQSPTLAQTQQHQGSGPYAPAPTVAQSPTLAQTQQHQSSGPYATVASGTPAGRGLTQYRPWGYSVPAAVAAGGTGTAGQNAASSGSGIDSTTAWITAAAVLGAAFVGAWALARRRRRRHEAAPICEVESAGC
jgi:hypothetical protein